MHSQTPVQIAWVTRNLAATEAALTGLLGAKKWIRMPGIHFGPEWCTHRGAPADFVADIPFSYAGDTQLEVIEPVSGVGVYSEFLEQIGSRPSSRLQGRTPTSTRSPRCAPTRNETAHPSSPTAPCPAA